MILCDFCRKNFGEYKMTMDNAKNSYPIAYDICESCHDDIMIVGKEDKK